MFASLVQLDHENDGGVGEADKIYDSTGELIRQQGSIFNSPLHFIGFGQGAVVNSEIVQRLGTFYPDAGGVNSDRDLHFSVIDPVTYGSRSKNANLKNILDPAIMVWDNVTYADVFYQKNDGNPFPLPTTF